MAVELMTTNYRNNSFVSQSEETAGEAASGLQSVENLLRFFSSNNRPPGGGAAAAGTDYAAAAGAAVNKFKKVISLLDRTRTGHARFRRAPVTANSSDSSFSSPNSVLQNISGEGDLAEDGGYGKIYCPTPIQQVPPPDYYNKIMSASSGGKPPLKRKCASSENGASGKCSGSSGRCHCKRRKLKVKRVVRVPAISMKVSDIPPDDYSWRKYGQKPIKGSPHPRGYYKCSSVRGCPARKHVERDGEDPTMLILTYEGDHTHSLPIAPTPSTIILESS